MANSVFFSDRNSGYQHLSESVYIGLCRHVGTSKQLIMRRQILDVRELIENQSKTHDPRRPQIYLYTSGSHREGFRLAGSDRDFMYWVSDHKVIWGLSQVQNYTSDRYVLILADDNESPPGFSVLKLFTPTYWNQIARSCINIRDDIFISSSLFREEFCSTIMPNSNVHGPCGSGTFGRVEYDYAHCFSCDIWPPVAMQWIERSLHWPSSEVVHKIIQNGCHFVPIGHKLSKHENLQWRISFSLAEQQLVYHMNHCQFLTYGLLKLFLKEVINKDTEEKLLCSYHMKTAVFWVIQQNTIPHWNPQNLLQCFWTCFKVLLKWVYLGVCPSFFIPENNLFQSSIHGAAQANLFQRLYGFYEKGVGSLLQSLTVKPFMLKVLQQPNEPVCTDENRVVSEVDYDILLFKEIFEVATLGNCDIQKCLRYLSALDDLKSTSFSEYQLLCLENILAISLQTMAFLLSNQNTVQTRKNKLQHKIDKVSCNLLKTASSIGFVSNSIFLAMYWYKTSRYEKALVLLEKVKVKLTCPYILYCLYVDDRWYLHALSDQTLSLKMREAVTWNIKLYNSIPYIQELRPEQAASKEENLATLNIPPVVMVLFLQYLCSRHADTEKTLDILREFQALLESDHSVYVPSVLKDISWELLGICHQVSENYENAFNCYLQSIKQVPLTNQIRTASYNRAQEMIAHMGRIHDQHGQDS